MKTFERHFGRMRRCLRHRCAREALIPLLLVALLVIAGTGCGGDDDDATEGGAETVADEPVRIGVVSAETGPIQGSQVPYVVGVRLAVQDINARGGINGRPVELITGDTKSDRALGPTVTLEVIDKGAEVVIVGADFDFDSPAALAAQDKGLIAMSLGSGSIVWGPKGGLLLGFTPGTPAVTDASAAAEWGYNEKEWRSVYVLTDTSVDYTKTWNDFFVERFRSLAGDSAVAGSDSFNNSDASFAAQVTKLRSALSGRDIDVVVSCTYPPGAPTLLRQIRAAGIDVPIVSCIGLDGAHWLEAVPNLSDLYYATFASIAGDDENEQLNEFFARYREEAQAEPTNSAAVSGYSAVEALALAIERAGTTNGEELKATLESFNQEDLLVGATTFTPELHISLERPVAIMEVRDGRLHFVTRLTPADLPPIE